MTTKRLLARIDHLEENICHLIDDCGCEDTDREYIRERLHEILKPKVFYKGGAEDPREAPWVLDWVERTRGVR